MWLGLVFLFQGSLKKLTGSIIQAAMLKLFITFSHLSLYTLLYKKVGAIDPKVWSIFQLYAVE